MTMPNRSNGLRAALMVGVIGSIVGYSFSAAGQPADTQCCSTVKPVCPSGRAPIGSPGCWRDCGPVEPIFCTAVCRPQKPPCTCPYVATGVEGCWGCCQHIANVLGLKPAANAKKAVEAGPLLNQAQA